MSGETWEAGVGLALASSATDEPATPKIFLSATEANIVEAPVTYERKPSYGADVDYMEACGFDYTFSVSGITADLGTLGYLLFLMLGNDAFSTPNHTITRSDAGQYLNLFLDRQADIEPGAGTDPVQRLIGGRLTKLRLEQPMQGGAVISIEGMGTTLGTPLASITPSIPTGATKEPLGWKHWKTGSSGFLKLGLNGGVTAQDDTIQSWWWEITRNAFGSGKAIGSDQYTDSHVGDGDIMWGFEKEFKGTDAIAQYAAFKSQQTFEIDAKATISTDSIEIAVPRGFNRGSILSGGGRKNELYRAKFDVKAYKNGATAIMTCTVDDGSSALYT